MAGMAQVHTPARWRWSGCNNGTVKLRTNTRGTERRDMSSAIHRPKLPVGKVSNHPAHLRVSASAWLRVYSSACKRVCVPARLRLRACAFARLFVCGAAPLRVALLAHGKLRLLVFQSARRANWHDAHDCRSFPPVWCCARTHVPPQILTLNP